MRVHACMHWPGWLAGSIPPELGDSVGKDCPLSKETPNTVARAGPRHDRDEPWVSLAFKC